MIDVFGECVFEAVIHHGARGTNCASPVDTGAVNGEENSGREVAAIALSHPSSCTNVVIHRVESKPYRAVNERAIFTGKNSVNSADSLYGMSETAAIVEPSRGHARIVYLGPASPHWELYSEFGDPNLLEEFRARVLARLVLLPRNDPQFRRNQERVNRDAERERITVEWELGWAADA
jgi:hypothetical protein